MSYAEKLFLSSDCGCSCSILWREKREGAGEGGCIFPDSELYVARVASKDQKE